MSTSCQKDGDSTRNLLLARGLKVHSLYPLYVTLREGHLFLVDIPMSSLWHGRCNHLSKADIMQLSRSDYIPKLSFSNHQFYEHCCYGKQAMTSHPMKEPSESNPLNLVQSVPWRRSYFNDITFINDMTRKVSPTKDRVFQSSQNGWRCWKIRLVES